MPRSSRALLYLLLVLLPAVGGCLGRADFFLAPEKVTYLAGVDSTFVVVERRTGDRLSLRFRIWRVLDPAEFLISQPDPTRPGGPVDPDDYYASGEIDTDEESRFRLLDEWSEEIHDSQYWRTQTRFLMPATDPGLYVVEARAGGRTSTAVLMISSIDLVVKRVDDRVVAFVAERIHGARIAAARVVAGSSLGDRSAGSTTSDGVADLKLDRLYVDSAATRRSVVVVAEHRGSVAVAITGGGVPRATGSSTIYLHTDRPLYTPGDEIGWRAIIRETDTAGVLRVPRERGVAVTLFSPDGSTLFQDSVELSDLGTIAGRIPMAAEGRRGAHTLRISHGRNYNQTNVDIAEHQTSGYDLSIAPTRHTYAAGEEIGGVIEGRYFAGDPVAGGDVEYTIGLRTVPRNNYIDAAHPSIGQEQIATIHVGRGKLDSSGRIRFAFTPQVEPGAGHVVRITARVTDRSRRSVSRSLDVRIDPGLSGISLHTSRRIYRQGDTATISRLTLPSSLRAGDSVVVRTTVRVERPAPRGFTLYDSIVAFRANDSVRIPLRLDSAGAYQTTVEILDRGKSLAREAWSIYVLSRHQSLQLDTLRGLAIPLVENEIGNWSPKNPAWWGRYNNQTSMIVADREEYNSGDTILAIVSAYPSGADLFITLEGEAIHTYGVERSERGTMLVKVPVPDGSASQIYLGIATISYSSSISSVEAIRVVPSSRRMKIVATAEVDRHRPGDTALVALHVADRAGRPIVDADIAVAVVDEALYALRADAAPAPYDFFYATRWNRVGTTKGRDFWFSRPQGEPEEDTPLDVSSLPLDRGSRSRSRDRSSRSSSSPTTGEAPRNNDGPRGDMFPIETIVRDAFSDLALWAPALRTDANGNARLSIPLPGNLTSWRLTARGVSLSTDVGDAVEHIVARRELMARLEAPVYLTEGDSMTIAGVVQNHTDAPVAVRATLSGEGVMVSGGDSAIGVPPHGERRVDWRVVAPSAGDASLSFAAVAGAEGDGERRSFVVLPKSIRSGVGASIHTDNSDTVAELSLEPPPGAIPSSGRLAVRYSGSSASSALSALEQLVGYPYGCVEQTMNKFHPVAVIAGTLDELKIPFDTKLNEEVPKMVQSGLARLYQLQHSSGSWGWFREGGDPMMTAYVMYGLVKARAAGFNVDASRFERGARALRRLLGLNGESVDQHKLKQSRAYLLYVASLVTGRGNSAVADRLHRYADEPRLDNYALSLLLLTAAHTNDMALAAELAARLEASAIREDRRIYWSGGGSGTRFGSDPLETTAFAIRALLAAGRPAGVVRDAVRWIVEQKRGSAWRSTWHSSVAIDAITDYLKVSPELATDYSLIVKVNGAPVHSIRIRAADLGRQETIIDVGREFLKDGRNIVTIEKDGVGELLFSASLGYSKRVESFEPDTAGFVVTRSYRKLSRRQLDGAWVYAQEPFTGAVRSGDELLVTVAITSREQYEYAMLEDPIPPGFAIVAESDWYTILDTAGVLRRGRTSPNKWSLGAQEMRNGILASFAPEMSAARFETSYVIRAELPGSFLIPPAVASLTYFPDVRGSSGSQTVRVE